MLLMFLRSQTSAIKVMIQTTPRARSRVYGVTELAYAFS